MAFSVYVHVPFCRTRCRYCAFYSGEPVALLEDYPRLVEAEIDIAQRSGSPRGPARTVYFGGGTPSLLPPEGASRILRAVERAWGIEPDAEVSMEINPGGSTDLPALRAAGVTRASVGVQCLDDGLLAFLGRSHTAHEARSAVDRAIQTGFSSVGVDLLYGIPGLGPRVLAQWAGELADLGTSHVSAYSLEIHEGTSLASEGFEPASSDEEEAQWLVLCQELEARGLGIYEVSNFARPGAQCRHNHSYWNGTAYLGLGPGAHSFAPERGAWGERSWNAAGMAAYGAHLRRGAAPPGGRETLDREQAFLETLFLSLRRAEPIDVSSVESAFGLDPGGLDFAFHRMSEHGYARGETARAYVPTPEGMRRADGLATWICSRISFGANGPS